MIRATRPTLHVARPEDAPVEVRRLDFESEWHYGERVRAIHALGVRWVRHPSYRFDPRHSANPEVWKPAFAESWKRVLEAAARDRAKNPAYTRAEAVRTAMGPA